MDYNDLYKHILHTHANSTDLLIHIYLVIVD